MPQQLLSELDVASLRVNEAGSRVSESVETRGPHLPRNVGAVENRIEHIFPHDIRIEWRSVRLTKDAIRRPNVSRDAKMLPQNRLERTAKRNRSHTGHG